MPRRRTDATNTKPATTEYRDRLRQ
jgi:hypothetical protein